MSEIDLPISQNRNMSGHEGGVQRLGPHASANYGRMTLEHTCQVVIPYDGTEAPKIEPVPVRRPKLVMERMLA